jgi:adenine deaminase
MITAINELVQCGGGMVVIRKGRTLARVPLPIAGLMSDRPVEAVAAEVERLKEAWGTLGCTLPSPYMNLALTTLSVIPKLRITDMGLVDTVKFKFVSPIIE